MKRLPLFLLVTLCCANLAVSTPPPPIEVYFSPEGGCTQAVVDTLGKAKKLIRVQAYSFTSTAIAKALVDAHKRGVQVHVSWTRASDPENIRRQILFIGRGLPW